MYRSPLLSNVIHAGIMCVLSLVSCTSAEVGSGTCGAGGCKPPRVDTTNVSLPALRLVPEALPVLAPTSEREALKQSTSLVYTLSTDHDATLWEFTDVPDGLAVRATTNDGAVSESVVEPPSRAHAQRAPAVYTLDQSVMTDRGPVVALSWSTDRCDGGTEQGETPRCPWPETLLFEAIATDAPQRVHFERGASHTTHFDDHWLSVTSSIVNRFDTELHMTWSQDAAYQAGMRQLGGVTVLAEGDTVIYALSDERIPAREELWRLDGLGRVVYHTHTGSEPSRYTWHPLLHDTLDRIYEVHTTNEGDLVITRIDGSKGEHSTTLLIGREEYADLVIEAVTVDSAGTLYVATQTGSRDVRRPAICRLAERDEADCFMLSLGSDGASIDRQTMQATDPNVLYIAQDTTLLRYEFPEPSRAETTPVGSSE